MKLQICVPVLAAFAFSGAAFAQPVTQAVASGCYANNEIAVAVPILNSTVAAGTNCDSAFLVRYFADLTAGDSYIDATNDGSVITIAAVQATPATFPFFTANYSTGNICMNVYTFDPAEELVSCCSCLITPNGLVSLSAQQDLISNTLTPASPTAITVKLLATTPSIQGSNPLSATQSCNPSFPAGLNASSVLPNTLVDHALSAVTPGTENFQNLAPALHAWASTIHAAPGGAFHVTETKFSSAALSEGFTTGPKAGVTDELTRITTLCGFNQSNGSGFGQCKSCRAGGLGATQQ